MCTKFFSVSDKAVRTADDWRSLMASGNWQSGRSAERLAAAWLNSNGFPAKVTEALDRVPEFKDMDLERGVVEHTSCVPGQGRGSTTDLMVRAHSPYPIGASIAVEGKVDESFDAKISSWLQKGKSPNSATNRRARMVEMCNRFGLTETDVERVRYQLLHRTYAAVAEAKARGHEVAMLLVHSFSLREETRPGWRDFEKWAAVLSGQKDQTKPDVPRLVKCLDGIQVWLLWISDCAGVCHPKQRQ